MREEGLRVPGDRLSLILAAVIAETLAVFRAAITKAVNAVANPLGAAPGVFDLGNYARQSRRNWLGHEGGRWRASQCEGQNCKGDSIGGCSNRCHHVLLHGNPLWN
jgi:hypothetical protein